MTKSKYKYNYDIKTGIKKYIPSLLDLLGDQDIAWHDINKAVSRYLDKVRRELALTQAPVVKEASFYTIINNKVSGNGKSDAQFDFYNELFKNLNIILSYSEKSLVHRILKNILTQPAKDYLNFIGELATLLFYKSNTILELLNIEEKISNDSNVSADFLFINKLDGVELLIEVVNIHLEYKDDLNNETLKMKIESKLDDKKKATLINPDKYIGIQPVLWIKDYNQLKMVSDFYHEYNFQPEKTMIPLCYVSFADKTGGFIHKFDYINVILKK
jgi:hypothetical protein